MTSLRTRSLLTIIAVVVPLIAVFTVLGYMNTTEQINRRFDARMVVEARVLEASARKYGADAARLRDVVDLLLVDKFPVERVFSIQFNGRTLLQSKAFPALGELNRSDFATAKLRDTRWRTYARSFMTGTAPQTAVVVRIAEPMPARSAIIWEGLLNFTLPILIAVPLTILGIYVALIRSLHPLSHFADQIRERSADQLQPIAIDGVPREALPIAESVNSLMARIADSLERERRFTADAAHELRTPLTALKAVAQVGLRTRDNEERLDTLRVIERTVNRTDRLVTQLLTLARLDPLVQHIADDDIDLAQAAQMSASQFQDLANARQQHLQLHTTQPVLIRADADALAILLRNLIENAILYSHDHTTIAIRVRHAGESGIIEIEDRGPGIADAEKQQVFRRFRRIPGTRVSGAGLGLSIVQRIVELHQGEITLSDVAGPASGLCVTIRFRASNAGRQAAARG